MEKVKVNSKTPVVLISTKVLGKIMYINKVIKNREWASFIIYRFEKGDDSTLLDDKKETVINVIDLFPTNIGEVSFVSKDDDKIVRLYKEYPEYMDDKIGTLHSHHSMEAFFSGTDLEDIVSNSEIYGMYLSIVTNNLLNFVCKIGLKVRKQVEEELIYKSYHGKSIKIKRNNEYYSTEIIDPIVTIQDFDIENKFYNIVNAMIEEDKAKKELKFKSSYQPSSYRTVYSGPMKQRENTRQLNIYDDYLDDDYFDNLYYNSNTQDSGNTYINRDPKDKLKG